MKNRAAGSAENTGIPRSRQRRGSEKNRRKKDESDRDWNIYCKGEKEYPTEDNHFVLKYKGMRYAPGIPMTPLKKFLGWVIYLVGKKLSKTVVITYKK